MRLLLILLIHLGLLFSLLLWLVLLLLRLFAFSLLLRVLLILPCDHFPFLGGPLLSSLLLDWLHDVSLILRLVVAVGV